MNRESPLPANQLQLLFPCFPNDESYEGSHFSRSFVQTSDLISVRTCHKKETNNNNIAQEGNKL